MCVNFNWSTRWRRRRRGGGTQENVRVNLPTIKGCNFNVFVSLGAAYKYMLYSIIMRIKVCAAPCANRTAN